MATYYVNNSSGSNGNNGTTSGTPWKTLAYAVAHVSPGDTVNLQTSTWKERLDITVANTTWQAQTGHTPVIDGNYHDGLFGQHGAAAGKLPPPPNVPGNVVARYEALVELSAANVVVDGLTVRNSGGEGIGINGSAAQSSGCKIRNCVIDFTYTGSISLGDLKNTDPKRTGIEITGNIISRSTWCYYDPLRFWADWSGVGPKDYVGEVVAQTMKVSCTSGAIVRGNVGAYSAGEGYDLGKGNVDCLFENNISFGHRHYHIYLMYSRDTTVRGNICFWPQNQPKPNEGPPNPPGGIGIRDENEGLKKGFAVQNGAWIYNNLVVGLGHPFGVAGTNSATVVERLYVGYNTFVGGPKTDKGMVFSPSVSGKHKGIVENNVIDYAPAPAAIPIAQGNKDSLVFRNNCWSKAPPAAFQGAGDQTGNPRLANSGAAVTGQDATGTGIPTNTFNKLHYQLTGSSTLCIGRASNGSPAGGITPPNVSVDILGATRGANRDIGAFEYGGVVIDSVTASFTQAPSTGTTPLSVQFTDTSTATGNAVINSRSWAFGDGGTSTATNPSHVYSAAGTYQATLTVQDTVLGKTSTYTGPPITVGAPPTDSVTANFTQSPSSGVAPLSVQFTNTSTATGAAVINSYEWEFGDGGTSTNPSPLHAYTTPGTYQATLVVQDTVLGKVSSKIGPPITVSAVVDSVTAGFTQDKTGGQKPLTVAFTDTSVEGGAAAINSWEWAFGDGGTSTAQSPSHIYTTEGVYTPKLTVRDTTRGLADVKNGLPIVVTTGTTTPPGSVMIRQTRAALNTSDGNQTFSQAGLGGLIPKSAIIRVTKATADGVAADGALLAIGYVTGANNQVACCIAADHGAAATNAARRWTDDACILLIDGSGAVVLKATFVAFVADGITLNLNWTAGGTAYLATVEFGAGPDYRAWAGAVALGAVNSSVGITAPGFAPDAGRFAATWGTRDTPMADATLSLGIGHRSGAMYCLERYGPDNQADATFASRLNTDQVAHCRYNTQGRARVETSNWDGQGVTLSVVTNDVNSSVLVLLEQFGAGSQAGLLTSPTVAGAVDYALPWDPQYVTHILSPRTSTGSANNTAVATPIGLHSATADGEYSDTVAGEEGAATTNEQSLSDNQVMLPGHTGTTVAAGTATLGTAKYTIDWTTAPAAALLWPYLAVEAGETGGPPIAAEFTGAPLSGRTPLTVAFTDLTGGATSWSWDFGDGETSAEQNPTHTYTQDGVYDVSLTAGDGANSDTETKTGYVVVSTPTKRVVVIGPYLLKPITATSTQQTTWPGEDEDVERGTQSGELSLDFLPLNTDVAAPEANGAELRVWFDGANLKAKLPDGTIKTITWT